MAEPVEDSHSSTGPPEAMVNAGDVQLRQRAVEHRPRTAPFASPLQDGQRDGSLVHRHSPLPAPRSAHRPRASGREAQERCRCGPDPQETPRCHLG